MKKTLLVSAVLLAFASVASAEVTTQIDVTNGSSYQNAENVNILNGSTDAADGVIFVSNGSASLTGSSINVAEATGAAIYAKSLETDKATNITVGTTGSNVTISNMTYGVRANNADNGSVTELAKVTVKGSSLTIDGGKYGAIVQGQYTKDDAKDLPIEKRASISLLSDSTTIKNVDSAIFTTGAGQVDVKGNELVIDAENAITTRGHSVINIDSKVAKIKGDISFDSDYEGGGNYDVDSVVNMNLSGKDSYWEGAAVASWNEKPGDEIDSTQMEVNTLSVTLKDGAKWIPTQQTKASISGTSGETRIAVNSLKLADGIVEVGAGIEADVEVLSGQGTVHMDSTNPGKFNVTEDGSEATLSVTMTGNADSVTEEKAAAVMANVTGVANATGTVEEGMYNGAMTLNAKGEVTAVATNSVMSNTLDLASAAPLAMNRLLMNDVRKRMGDLRSAEGTHGVWARYDGGKLSGERGLENDFTTVQVGIDTVPVVDAPRFGVAFAYTKSDADMMRGNAEMDAFSLAFYGTKFYDNGMFVDVIGRMATADTDVTVEGQKGTMDNVALSLSGELGWRFDVTEKFYFEPQAELTYTYVNADKLALGDSSYEFDSVDSLMGRIGFAAGFKCPSNFGDVYVRASAVHEFLGDSAVTGGNGTIHEVDGEDTWVEFGIGANLNINKNTYVYADIERTEGAKLEEDWRANVGVRFAF